MSDVEDIVDRAELTLPGRAVTVERQLAAIPPTPSSSHAVNGTTRPVPLSPATTCTSITLSPILPLPPPRPRPRPTHFLCIPLITPTSRVQLESALSRFKTDLAVHHRKIPANATRPVGSLHLTLDVMYLPDPSEIAKAQQALASLPITELLRLEGDTESDNRADSQALVVQLRSLKAMGNPYSTSVLYAEPLDPTGRLPRLARAVIDHFISAGLIQPQKRAVKLHATFWNSKYIAPRHTSSWHKVDARGLFRRYKNHVWADDVVVDRVALCEMGARKVYGQEGEVVDEVYEEIASVGLGDTAEYQRAQLHDESTSLHLGVAE